MEITHVIKDGMFHEGMLHKYVHLILPESSVQGIVTEVYEEIMTVQVNDEESKTVLVDIDDVLDHKVAVLVIGQCNVTK